MVGGSLGHLQYMSYKLILWVSILAKEKRKEQGEAWGPVFIVLACKWQTSLPLLFRWLELSFKVTPSNKKA